MPPLPPLTDPELARTVEVLAARAWPAAIIEELDGWKLRYSGGVTLRANSVWPQADGVRPLEEKIAAVNAWYRGHRFSPCFQISALSQPSELDAILAEHGFDELYPTYTQSAPLTEVIEKTDYETDFGVQIRPKANADWFHAYCQAEQITASGMAPRVEILQRITDPTAFVLVTSGGRPIATGLGVLQKDWVGIFSIATEAGYRRRGAATHVLHELAKWALTQGVQNAYLQVLAANKAGCALYQSAGFSTLFSYHYRQASPRK